MSEARKNVRIEAATGPVTVKHHDAVIGSSERAMVVHGEMEGAVYYLPKEDVYFEQMTDGTGQDTTSTGRRARFWSIVASGGGVQDAAWQLTAPDGQMSELADYIGFDGSRVSVSI